MKKRFSNILSFSVLSLILLSSCSLYRPNSSHSDKESSLEESTPLIISEESEIESIIPSEEESLSLESSIEEESVLPSEEESEPIESSVESTESSIEESLLESKSEEEIPLSEEGSIVPSEIESEEESNPVSVSEEESLFPSEEESAIESEEESIPEESEESLLPSEEESIIESEEESIVESEEESLPVSEESSIEESESEPLSGTHTIEIYASNDFHGHVLEDGSSMGLEYYGTFMKEKGKEYNTLTLDQGDTWQGSIYSNINHGHLINDVMCYARLDARTLGNHDFDWGIEKIQDNTTREYDDYRIPVLGANVYDYDFDRKIESDVFRSDLCQKSVSYTLESGVKVGVVGVIGGNQISSISSMYTMDVCFKNHIKAIKDEATRLRDEDGCHVVIASCHCGEEDLLENELGRYVDLVLCAHTHREEYSTENGVLFAQFGCNNQQIGHITLTYNASSNEVTNTEYESLSSTAVKNRVPSIDPTIHQLVSDAVEDCEDEANVVVANNVSGYFDKNNKSVNVMCKAIMDKVVEEGMNDVILSYCNNARSYLPYNQWTYANLYDSFPFDNLIYIIEVSGYEIQNEIMQYNRICRHPSFDGNIDTSKTYKIACLDYLAFHTNSSRYFDYFPDNKGNYVSLLCSDNYRILLREWLIDNGYNKGKSIYSSDFDSSLEMFSTSFNLY
ncbi:MAG: bifunctional metallophosphatase/5'-nucleotidase [Bacilli bacterium]|nr:bifunctional metallophosphatase/5'-nucleotidase [Bacilli bacterium]